MFSSSYAKLILSVFSLSFSPNRIVLSTDLTWPFIYLSCTDLKLCSMCSSSHMHLSYLP